MYDTASDSKILLDTVQKFMADEIYPHEDRVDKLGYVPDEIGKQIEEKSKEVGLFAAIFQKNTVEGDWIILQ